MCPNIENWFIDKNLFALGLTHSSWVNEAKDPGIESNERLEFLGDAILDAAVGQFLYMEYPNYSEGDLTKLRSSIVSGNSLSEAARALGLGEHLVLGKGEEASGGRDKDSNLANVFEALVGALFLDRGYDVASRFILENLDIESKIVSDGNDSKTELQIVVQAKCGMTPHYRIISKVGPDHQPTFKVEVLIGERVIATGKGTSRTRAEMHAASRALKTL